MERLVLPGVLPSVNHQYSNALVNGRRLRVLSPKAKQYASETVLHTTIWRAANKWQTTTGKTIVRLWYFWPDARKRDTHNTLKLLLDCFEDAGIYENDQYALPQIMDFEIDRKNPRVEVEFEVMEHAHTG